MPVREPEVGKFYRYGSGHLAYVTSLEPSVSHYTPATHVTGIVFPRSGLSWLHGEDARMGFQLRKESLERLPDA